MNEKKHNQRPEKQGKIRFERSAGAVAYRRRGRTVLVFFLLDPYHKWAVPKGHIDPGEKDEVAAVRELGEEAGMSGVIEGDLGTIVLKFRRKNVAIRKTVHYYLVHVPWNSRVTLQKRKDGKGEHFYGYRWMPAKRAEHVSDYENMRPVIKKALDILATKYARGAKDEPEMPDAPGGDLQMQ